MSLQSDCDIDPSDIDGLEISHPVPHILGMGDSVIVRKVDETTCLVAWASFDEMPDSPQDSSDPAGEVVILENASPEQKERVKEALMVEDIDRFGRVDPYDWADAVDLIEADPDVDEHEVMEDLARIIARKSPPELIQSWVDGMALQRIIPEEWFVAVAVDDPDTRQWLLREVHTPDARGHVTDRMRARYGWAHSALDDAPCAEDLRELADDLGLARPTREQIERFVTCLLKRGDDQVLFEEFTDQAWYAYCEENMPLGNPDVMELDYSYHSNAGPIRLKVNDYWTDRPKALFLFNKEGRKELDRYQDRAAFASLEEGPNGQLQVHVDPEFLDAMELSETILEFSDWEQAWDWFDQVEEQKRFCLTALGREIGRRRIRHEVAKNDVQQYEDWVNGNVYVVHVERCDYDPETGEWAQTEEVECNFGHYGDRNVASEMKSILDNAKYAIAKEKAQEAPVAA